MLKTIDPNKRYTVDEIELPTREVGNGIFEYILPGGHHWCEVCDNLPHECECYYVWKDGEWVNEDE